MEDFVFGPAQILLPEVTPQFRRWPVIACDQFTSQPEYWEAAAAEVGEAPSTLHIIYPEVYLEGEDPAPRTRAIHQRMEQYRREVLTQSFTGYMYVERRLQSGKLRQGLVGCVDLEAYSYEKGAAPAIRPTENTVLERIPPRLAVRRGACLESPHILMLVDDEQAGVIELAGRLAKEKPPAYEVELMLDGGGLRGWRLDGQEALARMQEALSRYVAAALEKSSYGGKNTRPFALAVGDGNHSLASAKAYWEELKAAGAPADHPARHCLVELENIHSDAIEIEPIHRVVFGAEAAPFTRALEEFAAAQGARMQPGGGEGMVFSVMVNGEQQSWRLENAPQPLCVGFIEDFLAGYCERQPGLRVDYVHGDEAVRELSRKGAVGILLQPVAKGDLFRGVGLGGVLPKKTFSMGHAEEKRYYLECRVIQP